MWVSRTHTQAFQAAVERVTNYVGFPNTHARTCRPKVAPIWDTLLGHSCGTLLLQKSRCEAARRAFRTRLPPKVTRQVSKTSVSYETSSKNCTSRLQNERFVRDRSHANPNVTATFTSTITHDLTIPCACHKSFRIHTSNAHKVLRLPRNVTSVTPRNLTISCACHENHTSTPQNQHKVLCLPRKVRISSHHTTRLE